MIIWTTMAYSKSTNITQKWNTHCEEISPKRMNCGIDICCTKWLKLSITMVTKHHVKNQFDDLNKIFKEQYLTIKTKLSEKLTNLVDTQLIVRVIWMEWLVNYWRTTDTQCWIMAAISLVNCYRWILSIGVCKLKEKVIVRLDLVVCICVCQSVATMCLQ